MLQQSASESHAAGPRTGTETIRRRWEEQREGEGHRRPQVPTLTSPPERTWIWSDLHLNDPDVLDKGGRRFANCEAMNHELLRSWREKVGTDDTIICLGDVAGTTLWRNRGLLLEIETCPGRRVLILGNHDITREALKDIGFRTQHWVAMYDADPPLALTHRPLRGVPAGAVNVHGHHHTGWEPTTRHINVTVDRCAYQPVAMERILEEARGRL